MKQIILVVDDSSFMRKIVDYTLNDSYIIRSMSSGEEAIEYLKRELPSLILLDVTLTGMSGFELFEYLLSKPILRDIPVVFLALESKGAEKIKAIEMGAIDYIAKPFTTAYLRARVDLFARFLGSRLMVDEKNHRLQRFSEDLQHMVDAKTDRIMALQDTLIRSAGEIVDCRDDNTGGHIKRTEEYVDILGQGCIASGLYPSELDANVVKTLKRVAPLHDVGKIKIPDHILFKPGKLDVDEFNQMKKHTLLGSQIIEKIAAGAGNSSDLTYAKEIALTHHEHWNGEGYPYHLKGLNIPLSGRIMAIADVLDALVSKRVYKDAYDFDIAIRIINSESGNHFDPSLVEVFNKVASSLEVVVKKYSSTE